jgi:hypothetical protein
MKEQCMRALKMSYPDGVGTAQQHRDIIRVYAIGWGDSLKASGNLIALEAFRTEFAYIADPNWWPNETWAWWV